MDWLGDRIGRRNIRRWTRRARLAAPFLAVPAILGLLVLSVDLIEYQPQKSPRPATDRQAPVANRPVPIRSDAIRVEPQDLSSLSVVESPLSALSPASKGMASGIEPGAFMDAARSAHSGPGR